MVLLLNAGLTLFGSVSSAQNLQRFNRSVHCLQVELLELVEYKLSHYESCLTITVIKLNNVIRRWQMFFFSRGAGELHLCEIPAADPGIWSGTSTRARCKIQGDVVAGKRGCHTSPKAAPGCASLSQYFTGRHHVCARPSCVARGKVLTLCNCQNRLSV